MRKFELSSYYDLLNLHKALMEAKFHDNPDNEYIAGSPIIARIMNEIVDILEDIDPHANEDDWKTWRKLENHLSSTCEFEFGKTIWDRILYRVSKDKLWEKYNYEEKIVAIRNYFSPFITTDKEIDEFINAVDMKKNSNNPS